MVPARFTVLDSWRGIAACMVALFHVRAFSHLADLALVQHAFLFVDFFFVLSGFVLAAAYEERLAHGFSIWRFMMLRFGRVYPLHLLMLAVFVAVHIAEGGVFGSPSDSLEALIGNLALVHSLGLFSALTWNMPSWSISAEFAAYLAFALAASLLGANFRRALVAIVLVCPLALLALKGHIDATYDYAVVRALYGFAAGVLTWHLFLRWGAAAPKGTRAEAVAVLLALSFVAFAGKHPISLAAPFAFAFLVLVFAQQAGALSGVLRTSAFVWLGTVSYSIYMVHFFIARRMVDLIALAREAGFAGVQYLGAAKWAGDVTILVYMGLVLSVSALTYRFVEAPARQWFRRSAGSRLGARWSRAPSAP